MTPIIYKFLFQVLHTFYILSDLIQPMRYRYYYVFSFTDEEIKAQRC